VDPIEPLEYRMVFAIATSDMVYIFDTQHKHPIARIGNIHTDTITDLAWYFKFLLIFIIYFFYVLGLMMDDHSLHHP